MHQVCEGLNHHLQVWRGNGPLVSRPLPHAIQWALEAIRLLPTIVSRHDFISIEFAYAAVIVHMPCFNIRLSIHLRQECVNVCATTSFKSYQFGGSSWGIEGRSAIILQPAELLTLVESGIGRQPFCPRIYGIGVLPTEREDYDLVLPGEKSV